MPNMASGRQNAAIAVSYIIILNFETRNNSEKRNSFLTGVIVVIQMSQDIFQVSLQGIDSFI